MHAYSRRLHHNGPGPPQRNHLRGSDIQHAAVIINDARFKHPAVIINDALPRVNHPPTHCFGETHKVAISSMQQSLSMMMHYPE
eukprot:1153381-Pelagomonas_calceolata.AAC.2